MTGPRGGSDLDGRLDAARAVIEAAVRADQVPGAAAAVGQGPVTAATWVSGRADTGPAAERPVRAGTLFDLASLTKVTTATAVLALAGRGELGLDDPAGRYLPSFGALREATIRQLLAHTAGLPDTRQFYRWCATAAELRRDLHATPLQAPPGTRVAYSDPGFMALGEIIASVAGEPLDAAVTHLVTAPLSMTCTSYRPAGAEAGAVRAATAQVRPVANRGAGDEFAATERQPDGTFLTGTVHDENARLMGGVAGHAGLFAPVGDLAAFAAWWAGEDDVAVPARLRREAQRLQTAGLDGRRGLGWACQGDAFDFLPGAWPPGSVSHAGFTGTSLAIAPDAGPWAVLLTNAVHFGRDAVRIRTLRRDFHAALAPGAR